MEMTAPQKRKNTWTPKDIYQEVTDSIIRQLEKGTIPWQKPFIGTNKSILKLPANYTTGDRYRGINILLLWNSAIEKEYQSNEWATYKQWNEANEQVQSGETGHTIIKYNTLDKEVDGEIQKIPYLKAYKVFNRAQLVGYKAPVSEENPEPQILVEKINTIEQFVKNTKAVIEHKGDKAYYSRSEDKIVLPYPEYFLDTEACSATEGYYSVTFHELGHWTGDKNRLDRTKGKRFGDNAYAAEELVAEFSAAFLCSGFGIASSDHRNNAAYIDHWLKVLKSDKKIIFSAASEASKAVDYLKDLQPK
jgi:antirestriction protein ArdC